ncbi:hypothetical protein [Blastomonas sp. CCH8-A3]|jgi:hypothetical protein|uniref:hypothetical protein n=1 Tax=Blastomonas sp. CCH8-A3 TaxID=1768743 RepID=UPI0019240DD0|nr:hypothetical protein [Blastomonas sp. CCH8-A3]
MSYQIPDKPYGIPNEFLSPSGIDVGSLWNIDPAGSKAMEKQFLLGDSAPFGLFSKHVFDRLGDVRE